MNFVQRTHTTFWQQYKVQIQCKVQRSNAIFSCETESINLHSTLLLALAIVNWLMTSIKEYPSKNQCAKCKEKCKKKYKWSNNRETIRKTLYNFYNIYERQAPYQWKYLFIWVQLRKSILTILENIKLIVLLLYDLVMYARADVSSQNQH